MVGVTFMKVTVLQPVVVHNKKKKSFVIKKCPVYYQRIRKSHNRVQRVKIKHSRTETAAHKTSTGMLHCIF